MNPKPLCEARDEDARNVMAALIRAGESARRLAFQTQTNIVVVRNGKMVIEIPKSLNKLTGAIKNHTD